MESIEITNRKSGCCDSIIHVRHYLDGNYSSSEPYCTKCGEFPTMTEVQQDRLRELLRSGQLFSPTSPTRDIKAELVPPTQASNSNNL